MSVWVNYMVTEWPEGTLAKGGEGKGSGLGFNDYLTTAARTAR